MDIINNPVLNLNLMDIINNSVLNLNLMDIINNPVLNFNLMGIINNPVLNLNIMLNLMVSYTVRKHKRIIGDSRFGIRDSISEVQDSRFEIQYPN
jgi:hypothetical protein